jgi:hypothetical protein
MTERERILRRAEAHREGVDVDTLAVPLGVTRRQHVNQGCGLKLSISGHSKAARWRHH